MTKAQRLTLWATIIGSGVVFLDGSVVNLALPHMGKDLDVGFAGLQWIVDGYLLSLSALILLGGSLGDILGRKRIYLVGLLGFGVASLLCALAPNAMALIAARVLQGVFGALMIPGSLAIINTNFSPAARAGAIGTWTACTSAIIAAGPLLGGYLVDHGSWRLIFLLNVPLLALCFVLGAKAIKESSSDSARNIDITGGLLAMGALAGTTYGLIEGPADYWGAVPVAAIAIGVALAVVFVWFERRSKDPMLPISLFASRNFVGVNLTTFAMYGALGGFFFAFAIYLQNTLAYSSLEAGLSMLPVTIFILLLSGRAAKLAATYGPRLFMTIGPIIAGIGIALLVNLRGGADYWTAIMPGIVLFGVGMGLTVSPLTNTIFSSVRPQHSGIASAVNNAVSRVSGLLIVALLGLLGSGNAYRFAAILCSSLAILAGVLSFFFIRNDSSAKPQVS